MMINWHVVWKMGLWKAPGPDGLQMGFYKEYWDTVGTHATQTALGQLTGQLPFDNYNFTDIALIPKIKNT